MKQSYLFLDTSGSTVFGQIGSAGDFISFTWKTEKDLAGRITFLCDEMLKAKKITLDKIDFFAICTGPGSLTGLRVGISFMRALAQSLSKPMIGIDLFTWSAATLSASGGKESGMLVLPAFFNHLFFQNVRFPLSEISEPQKSTAEGKRSSKGAKFLNNDRPIPIKPEVMEITPEFLKKPLIWIRSTDVDKSGVEPSMEVLNVLLQQRRPKRYDFDELLQVKPMYVIPSQAEINLEKREKRTLAK